MTLVSSFLLLSLLLRASELWGPHRVLPARVEFRDMGDCDVTAGWTTFHDRSITLNTECEFTPSFLGALLVHEMGHLLCGCADHSTDPRSIMNPVVREENQIMEEDRWRVNPQ